MWSQFKENSQNKSKICTTSCRIFEKGIIIVHHTTQEIVKGDKNNMCVTGGQSDLSERARTQLVCVV